MELKNLMVDTKEVWVDFPGLSGFSVKVANLSRKELNKLRKRCITQKFDRKSRQVVEELDEEKFVKEFSIAVVKDWKGLKLEHLETILLINTDGQDMSKELDYSEDNAEILVSQSTEFDTWLNEVVFDLDNFRSPGEGRSSSAAGEPVQES
jgi:U3 small nucleolar ribonucleoprotein component